MRRNDKRRRTMRKIRELTTKLTQELTMKHGDPFLTGIYYSRGAAMAIRAR